MSTIDAVIAQARRPGNFSERRRFTLARTQAIQKLRQFALADPAAYILELIQSAVANGATWIEVVRDSDTVTVAYIGGGIPESALGRLFDFLFASKDDPGLGYLRELAIGVNALMVFEPERIIIESGDGTLAGTSRMELLAGEDRLDVGRPDHALAGTFIRAEGLKRSRNVSRERGIIEMRCLAAPVPIFYNSEAIFGHSRQRVPALPGAFKRVSFDEGDLYGTIGLRDPGSPRNDFALLTRGVLIENVAYSLVEGHPFGGIICFDGLRKTADHARIVRDDRMTEMWLRVLPYARSLLGEQDAARTVRASEFDGTPIASVPALQAWLRAAKRVVVVAPELDAAGLRGITAATIARALSAKILRVLPEQLASLRILGGSGVELHAPQLEPDGPDVAFYRGPPASPPARPWLVQPIAAPPVTLAQLRPEPVAARLEAWLGAAAELRMRVYTPASSEHHADVEVVLHSSGRALGRFVLPSVHAGHVLVVELPAVTPTQLGARTVEDMHVVGESLATACLRHASATLAEAADRLLAGLVDPTAPLGPVERQRALLALTRSAVLRLRRDRSGAATLCFALVEPGPPGVDLLGLPLFTAASGEALGARDLAARMVAGRGWLRVHDGSETDGPVDLDGLILMDPTIEAVLARIVGESALLGYRGGSQREGVAAVDAEGRGYTTAQVEQSLRGGQRIVAHHARAIPRTWTAGEVVPDELWLTPWGWLRLAREGALLPALDFHLGDSEAREHADDQAFIASAPVTGAVEGVLGVPLVEPALPGVVVIDDEQRHVHRLAEVGHDFGVVGVLRLRDPRAEPEAIVAAIDAAVEQVYRTLLARVPAMDPQSPAFARATATMLAHAGRRVSLIADAHGRVRVPEVSELAGHILSLPLFPGRRGLPLAAWQLIRRFTGAGGELAAVEAELDLAATPPVLRAWIRETFARERIYHEPAGVDMVAAPGLLELDSHGVARPYPDPDVAAPLDEVTLATTAEYWLHHLRPDLAAHRPWDLRGRVWIELEGEVGDEFGEVTGEARHWRLALHRGHWLVRWAAKTGRADREAIAWLLLACYARINEVFDDVTNSHEGLFQRAVADALVQGRLAVVVPRLG